LTSIEKLAVVVAYEHHISKEEKGYPNPKHPWETNLITRIVRVAEAFDSLVGNTSFRNTMAPLEAFDKLLKEWQGEPEALVAAQLIRAIGFFPAGTVATLTSGEIVLVVRPEPDKPMNPYVRIVADAKGALIEEGEIVQTGVDRQIAYVLPPGKVPFEPMRFFPFKIEYEE
jgi:HD-GYP domain-containing protein (c-di-GMP phosphodiesterase class II)